MKSQGEELAHKEEVSVCGFTESQPWNLLSQNTVFPIGKYYLSPIYSGARNTFQYYKDHRVSDLETITPIGNPFGLNENLWNHFFESLSSRELRTFSGLS